MSVRVSCPYCNTGFALPGLPPAGRASCPRCGDSFPVRGRVEETAPGDPGPGDVGPVDRPHAPASPTLSAQRSHRARRSAARAVGVALAMGLAGLVVGLVVVYVRGGFRPPEPEPESGPSATATPPTELRGLGYLPPGSNIVLAVQPGPVLAYAARTNQDPRDLLIKAGLPASVLSALDRLGVTLPQIDHIAAGALIPDTDLGEFRLAVALVLRHPIDEARFLHHLKAQRVAQGGKTRYKVEFAGLQWSLARASETAWVFGWTEKDLDPAETGGKTQLSAGLREMLGEKLPTDAAVWAAADSARWAEKKPVEALIGLAGGKTDWLSILKKGQAAVVGLTFDAPPRLRVFVRCADADTGENLRAYFEKKASGDGARHGGAGEWAMLDIPADPQTGFATLKGFVDDTGK